VDLCLWLGGNGVAFSMVNERNILIVYGPTPPSEKSNHYKVDPHLSVKLIVEQLQLHLGFLILQQQQTLT
jgi:hypothetical protein